MHLNVPNQEISCRQVADSRRSNRRHDAGLAPLPLQVRNPLKIQPGRQIASRKGSSSRRRFNSQDVLEESATPECPITLCALGLDPSPRFAVTLFPKKHPLGEGAPFLGMAQRGSWPVCSHGVSWTQRDGKLVL